jgi:hypothetical protein
MREYWNDKKLAEKCGLERKDICVHEWKVEGLNYNGDKWQWKNKCKKCGEFYR